MGCPSNMDSNKTPTSLLIHNNKSLDPVEADTASGQKESSLEASQILTRNVESHESKKRGFSFWMCFIAVMLSMFLIAMDIVSSDVAL